jgi:hypothetical protein
MDTVRERLRGILPGKTLGPVTECNVSNTNGSSISWHAPSSPWHAVECHSNSYMWVRPMLLG